MGIAKTTSADTTSFGIHAPAFRLPATTRIGRVRLAVSPLAISVRLYSEVLGLAVLEREGNLVKLGAHDSRHVLLELEELPGVHPIGHRTRLGHYHTAFLLPSRSALRSFVQHLRQDGIEFGAADHLYSEAIYRTYSENDSRGQKNGNQRETASQEISEKQCYNSEIFKES